MRDSSVSAKRLAAVCKSWPRQDSCLTARREAFGRTKTTARHGQCCPHSPARHASHHPIVPPQNPTRAGSNALPRWQDWLQVGARAVLTHLADARRRCVDASRRPPATAARSAIARGSVQSAITPSFGARGGGLTWTYRYQILSGRNGLCPPMLSPIQNLLFFSKKMTPRFWSGPPYRWLARHRVCTRRQVAPHRQTRRTSENLRFFSKHR